uniref:Uncharacterized protein n=1 Tax=Arundo donax TaxID=35708 RepID=A0A0A9BJM9_ARUDO
MPLLFILCIPAACLPLLMVEATASISSCTDRSF